MPLRQQLPCLCASKYPAIAKSPPRPQQQVLTPYGMARFRNILKERQLCPSRPPALLLHSRALPVKAAAKGSWASTATTRSVAPPQLRLSSTALVRKVQRKPPQKGEGEAPWHHGDERGVLALGVAPCWRQVVQAAQWLKHC